MTTDEALVEQIARAIAARVHVRGEGAWRDYRAYATATLPILRGLAESLAALAPDVLKAQADAWGEGRESGWDEAQCTWQETGGVGDGWKHSTDPNPYRGEQTND
ncbi:hypothetical protein [Brachybacterium sp. AOP3-A1-3]|uniref:hypothetical protein n=1 Tax=Brachybacterium sp. AOP3-A1-3 TaxID=3457699 RepID=UPI0040343B71